MTWEGDQTPAVMSYPGGKHRIAKRIAALLPSHRVYVEPFGGAGNVLLAKKPSEVEVYNDLDSEVVNLFRVLRDPKQAAKLLEQLELTPFARDEFHQAYEPSNDPIESARRLLIRNHMSVGRQATFRRSDGFRWTTRSRKNVQSWELYPRRVLPILDRLRYVIIDNLPASKVIARYDAPDVCFYVDPPYLGSTRTSDQDRYTHEMRDPEEHIALLEQLSSCQGAVVLSGYDSEEYAGLLEGWSREVLAALALNLANERERDEVVWIKESIDPQPYDPTTDLASIAAGD